MYLGSTQRLSYNSLKSIYVTSSLTSHTSTIFRYGKNEKANGMRSPKISLDRLINQWAMYMYICHQCISCTYIYVDAIIYMQLGHYC